LSDIDPTGEYTSIDYTSTSSICISRCVLRSLLLCQKYHSIHPRSNATGQILVWIKLNFFLVPSDVVTVLHCIGRWHQRNTNNDSSSLKKSYSIARKCLPDSDYCDGTICETRCTSSKALLNKLSVGYKFNSSSITPMQDNAHAFPLMTMKIERNEEYSNICSLIVEAMTGAKSVLSVLSESPIENKNNSPSYISVRVEINSLFERVFGYSSSEIRELSIREGWSTIYHLIDRYDWQRLSEMERRVEFRHDTHSQFTLPVTCRHMIGTTFPALLVEKIELDDDKHFLKSFISFIPLTS